MFLAQAGLGFGVRRQGTTSDHWSIEFYYWLESSGFVKKA
jgi:hypothetical protein